jgi:hypothetical protein
MSAFTMPTLIIHGRADQGAPLALTAHGLFITEMERLNRDLLSFIKA